MRHSALGTVWVAVAALALLVAGVLPAGAQEVVVAPAVPAGEALTLTPAQAADLAEQQALEIKQAREGITQAEGAVGQAGVGRHLQASVSALEGRMGPVASATINGDTIKLGSDIVRQVTLSATQALYDGGRVEGQVAAARAGVGVATAQTDKTIRAVRLAAEVAVFNILRAKELAAVTQRQLDANREHLRLAQARFNAGTAPQFDVVQAQTQVSSAEGNVVAAETAVDQAVAGLRRVLALPQTQPLEAVAPEEQVMQPAGGLPDLIAVGWDARPEIRVLESQVQAAEANLRVARATDSLLAGVGGQVQYNGAPSFASAGTSWEVALSLSKPLLDGGLRSSLVKEAGAGVRAAGFALETERQQIALEVTQQYLAAAQALKQLQVATQGVVQAREAARIAEVRFQAEVGTGIEVIDAQTAQAAAEATQVNASHDLQLALIRLRDAMGQPLEGGSK